MRPKLGSWRGTDHDAVVIIRCWGPRLANRATAARRRSACSTRGDGCPTSTSPRRRATCDRAWAPGPVVAAGRRGPPTDAAVRRPFGLAGANRGTRAVRPEALRAAEPGPEAGAFPARQDYLAG